jgi:ring-1,2-phenylacetyl-CoA epoxidase subunit PaaE
VLDQNWALTQEELDAGFILTCQAHPTTDTLEISYDV